MVRIIATLMVLVGVAASVNAEVYVVNVPNSICSGNNDCGDDIDAQPGDGIAERVLGGGGTTLRAAIEEANALEGHDIIMLPNWTFNLRVELPPLTDPDGVTIMSINPNDRFILDGETVSQRLREYRDFLLADFGGLDDDSSDGLSYGETLGLAGNDVVTIVHNLGFFKTYDFNFMDIDGDGELSRDDLERFRGAGSALKINSPNNKIIGMTITNFWHRGIVIDGELADNNIIQGCYIGVAGTDSADRAAARTLRDSFDTLDGNLDGGLSVGESRNAIPGMSDAQFDRLDSDANNSLSLAELEAAGALVDTEIAQLLLDDFATADLDSSDSLNLTEAQTVVSELVTTTFDRLDSSANGQLETFELNNAIANGNTQGTSGIENGNREHGILISGGADGNLIGGPDPTQRNVISANGTDELYDLSKMGDGPYITLDFGNGIYITGASTTNNLVQGNYIGVDIDGISATPNAFSGVVIDGNASNNIIGGILPGEGNLISENGAPDNRCPEACGIGMQSFYGNGVYISGGTTSDNEILGNLIVRNARYGVRFSGVTSGKIGDAVEGAGNIIRNHSSSELGAGNISLFSCLNVTVENNISTGGEDAFETYGGFNLTIGSPGFGNVFSGANRGATISGGTDIFFRSNFVGVDENLITGSSNGTSGLYVEGFTSNVRIGGSGDGEGNVISGNNNDGIVVHDITVGAGATPVVFIQGNLIGTNVAGTAALSNRVMGILVGPNAHRLLIGGTAPGEGNTISGNGEDGIRIARRPNPNGTPDNITIFGNRIGLAAVGTGAIPNGLNGVALLQVDEEVELGGFGAGESNTIARNGQNGVRVKGGEVLDISSNATIRGNVIYGNALKGIALEEFANDDIVKPTVVGVNPVRGTAPMGSTVDIFSDSADEGQFYIGSAIADVDGAYSLAVDLGTLQANNITATATDLTTGNTSEFSDPLPLTPPVLTLQPMSVSVVEGDPFSLTVTATGSEPITFRWEVLAEGGSDFVTVSNDAVVSGALTSTLTNTAARLTDVGTYRCVATNILGDTPSNLVTVMVLDAATNTLSVSTLVDGAVDGNVQSPAYLQLNPGTDGVISLREAITAANNRAGEDTITFASGGVIALNSGLPALTDMAGGTTIDGGGLVTLDGNALGGSLVGLQITSPGNTLTGLSVIRCPGSGIELVGATATGNLVSGCLLGNNGTTAMANDGHGIILRNGASDNIIGGLLPEDRNVLSGNTTSGISITDAGTTGNRVIGNYIGVAATGTAILPNGEHGVLIQNGASDNEVGGVAAGEGNLISANTRSGVYVNSAGTTGNTILGNMIGVDSSGEPTLGNLTNGVAVVGGATNTSIGGTEAGASNVISGNAVGVSIDGATTSGNALRQNIITANFGAGIQLSNGGNGDMPVPVITMFGSVFGTAEVGSVVEIYVDEDDEGETLLDTVTTDSAGEFMSTIDLEAYAGMNITATATDVDGNTSEFSPARLIDLEPPVLTLLGAAQVTLQCGSGAYVDAGATAEDDVDGDITNEIQRTITLGGDPVNAVSPSVTGTYTILYEVSDNAGQIATPVQREVIVVDTAAPTLTLNGTPAVVVECGATYTDAGATATDACEGDIVVTVLGSVNTASPGVQVLTYSAVDSLGNAATNVTRTVTVADRVKPVITITGAPSVTVECGTSYVDAGATVADVCDSNVTVSSNNPVDPAVVGVYTVRYNATDSSGNAADEVIRVVEVVDTTIPVISLIGGSDITVACGSNFQDLGATVLDSCEGALPAIVSGVVTTNDPGNYTLTYTASDASGNVAEPVTRIVRVVDAQVPTITLIGSASVDVACEAEYQELGATAMDGCDGDLTGDVVTTGTVDTSVPGQYFVNYDVVDSFGNVANRVTRIVTVAVCPAPCESQCSGDPDNDIDEDGDGLSACIEACLGTSDAATDTDGDGVPDGTEHETGTDPAVPDSDLDLDNDGLSQLEEFIFGSDPLDPNSPAESFFVSPQGANSETGGSPASPWSSIEYALSQVSPTANNPVRLIIGEGNYPEDVVLVPWVTLVGASGTLPRIEGTVFGANNSTIQNLEIAAFTSDDVMLVMDNVSMNVIDVVFRGSASRPAAGILADGSRVAASVIEGCLFTSLSVGIDIGGGLPMIRRCTFEETSIAGVFVRSTANISSAVSLGDVTDPSTGSNLFAGVTEGRAVINEIGTTLLAQQNDWGTSISSTIKSNLVSGNVAFEPVLEPGTAANTASLFVTVWTAANQTRIGTATVKVTDNSGAAVTVTRNQNGVYPLPVLRSGNYTIEVSAFGFETQTTNVSLAARELGSRILALQTAEIKAGGPSCSPTGGSMTHSLWADLLLAMLLLGALLLDQRVGRFILKSRQVK